MFSARREQLDTSCLLKLEGDLTFQYSSDIRDTLAEALTDSNGKSSISISLDQVETFDLAGVQLLIAASKSADSLGIDFSLNPGRNQEYFWKLCTFSGLEDFIQAYVCPTE